MQGVVAKDQSRVIHSVSMANKRSLWGYRGDDTSPFIKITLTDYKPLARTRTAFERGEINFRGMFADNLMTYESNIPYTLRFMIDHKVRFHSHCCTTSAPTDSQLIATHVDRRSLG